jgi:hypothetical protein
MEAGSLLMRYAAEHNRGVRTGDFSGLVALLAPDAALRFFGVPVGPFVGTAAIAAAFAATPPTDELVLLGPPRDHGATAVAPYAWARTSSHAAGAIRIETKDGRVLSIDVTVGPRGRPPPSAP